MKMQKNKKLVQAAAVGLSVCQSSRIRYLCSYGICTAKNAEEYEKQIVSDEVGGN